MITLWRIPLDADRTPSTADQSILSEAERARVARFLRDSDRNRWLHAHIAQRIILSEALGVRPERIGFGAGSSGKPLVNEPAGAGLEFNHSDSGDLAILALSRLGPVGVDVERIRPLTDMLAIAESHFSPEERDALIAYPPDELEAAFYRCWTRKEAYIKALGKGLGHALGRFAVTIGESESRFIHLDGDREEAARWSLVSLDVPAGYVGALTAREQVLRTETLDYSNR